MRIVEIPIAFGRNAKLAAALNNVNSSIEI
jgi:hypothetical protein